MVPLDLLGKAQDWEMELWQTQVKESCETLAPRPWVAWIFAEVSLFRVLLYTEIPFASLVLHPLNWQNVGLRLDIAFSLRSWIHSRTLGVQVPAYHPITSGPETPSIQWLLINIVLEKKWCLKGFTQSLVHSYLVSVGSLHPQHVQQHSPGNACAVRDFAFPCQGYLSHCC